MYYYLAIWMAFSHFSPQYYIQWYTAIWIPSVFFKFELFCFKHFVTHDLNTDEFIYYRLNFYEILNYEDCYFIGTVI